jgi:hypothetical protein
MCAYTYGANPFTVFTNGVERLRVDSAGNLGLGVTPSAWASTYKAIQLQTGSLSSTTAGATFTHLTNGAHFNGTNWIYAYTSVGVARYEQSDSSGGIHRWFTAPSGTAGDPITFGDAKMTLTNAGILLIGTTNSPVASGALLSVSGSSDTSIQLTKTGVVAARLKAVSTGLAFGVDLADGDTERARITSGGDLYVGSTTSLLGTERLYVEKSGAGNNTAGFKFGSSDDRAIIVTLHSGSSGATSRKHFEFLDGAGFSVGNIACTGSATTYNTSSDQRLKENIEDADDAGVKIDAIRVRKFDWKSSGVHQDYGMVAQELITVFPDAVQKPDDEDAMMGVDYSKLVPMLIKEVQSLRQRVAELEAK